MHFVLIDKCLSLSPEINEDESHKEQKLPCVQNTDDIVDLSSNEKAEKRTDPALSPRYFMSLLTLSTSSISYQRSGKSPPVIVNLLISLFSSICFSSCLLKLFC